MIVPFKSDFAEFSVTNKGLLVSGDVPLRVVTKTTELGRFARFALFLGTTSSQEDSSGGIYLRKLGPKLFIRDLALPLAGFRDSTFNMMYTLEDVPNYFILMDPKSYSSDIVAFWDGAIHIPVHETLKLADVVPETLWEVASRVFLKPKHYSWTRYPAVLAMDFRGTVLGQTMEVVVLCHYTEGDLSPKCKAFWRGSYPREEAMIFEQRSNRNESIFWSQFEVDSPDILQRSHKVERRRAKKVLGISAWFEKGIVPSITSEVEIFSLKLVITVKDTAGIEIEVE
jgi:hypothetical protein